MTPNDIEVLLHYCVCLTPHPREDAPAVRRAIQEFVAGGILILGPSPTPDGRRTYEITARGKALVRMLCATPWPAQTWTDPRTKEEV